MSIRPTAKAIMLVSVLLDGAVILNLPIKRSQTKSVHHIQQQVTITWKLCYLPIGELQYYYVSIFAQQVKSISVFLDRVDINEVGYRSKRQKKRRFVVRRQHRHLFRRIIERDGRFVVRIPCTLEITGC